MDSDVFSPSNVCLDAAFYQRDDVVGIARELLGQVLVTQFEGVRTAGLITEVEAYRAPDDRACHAWNNRRTPRTEVMFRPGGSAYIYLCYGIHHLFNVVTGPEGAAHAVLIRGIEPLEGIDLMLQRRKARRFEPSLTTGPGALAQALGLHTRMSGQSLLDPDSPVWIERGNAPASIGAGPRIGVDYAGECAAWPWRFWVEGSQFYRKK
ncbi:MAG: DNA-3-methyladenine glycosylase [Saprospiraceae bacterium]|nr:DNA-3-methyladenine glycosylase [Saprospiraceae bacterium]